MKRTMIVFGLVVMLSACGPVVGEVQTRYTVEPKALSDQERAQVKKEIEGYLKDPRSAIYGDMFSFTSPITGKEQICVYVNAKNSYGGYTGEKAFLKSGGTWIIGLKLVREVGERSCLQAKAGYQLRYQ